MLGAKLERSVGPLPDGVYLGSIGQAPAVARAVLGTLASSETEPLVVLRYFGPEVNPDAPSAK